MAVRLKTEDKIYEGKAKILYRTRKPEVLLQFFKDDATAFNAEKKATIAGKGQLNCAISTLLFSEIKSDLGSKLPTHWLKTLDERTMRVKRVDIVKIEVVVRNIVAGSMRKRAPLDEGAPIDPPVVEFFYKDDALGDPMINDDHVRLLNLASPAEVKKIRAMALAANAWLRARMDRAGMTLVDIKFEFGRDAKGKLLLADEICPDTCRLWDKQTRRKLDKDNFRFDLGSLTDSYSEVLKRLQSTAA